LKTKKKQIRPCGFFFRQLFKAGGRFAGGRATDWGVPKNSQKAGKVRAKCGGRAKSGRAKKCGGATGCLF